MTWTQLRQPNVNKPCTPGWCLVYVQDVFGIPAKQPSALADWNANTYNHADQNFPEGVAVPIWFSGKSGDLKLYGHVAVRMADGSVWSASHPTSHEPMHFASIDALNKYYSYQLIYLGWTEDVEDVRVIEQEEDMKPTLTRDQVLWHYRLIAGVEPSEAELTGYTGKDYYGATEEIKRYFANAGLGYNAYKQHAEARIAELEQQLKDAGQKPTDSEAAKKLQTIQDSWKAINDALDVK